MYSDSAFQFVWHLRQINIFPEVYMSSSTQLGGTVIMTKSCKAVAEAYNTRLREKEDKVAEEKGA